MMGNQTQNIQQAARLIRAGKLVAFPTETVYGLGGDATSDAAVASIYEVKGRPSFNPLIVHMHSIRQATEYVQLTPLAKKLAASFWPGPLTMVLRRGPECALSLLVSAGLDTLAVRVPDSALAQEFLRACNVPLAAPSANRSGRISPTTAQHVEEELSTKVAKILDGGPCTAGLESTVVDATGDVPVLLRHGIITADMIRDVAGDVQFARADSPISSPGMLAKHYAPDTPMRLNATSVKGNEALLAFGNPIMGAKVTENLSPFGDLTEAAANLFAMLRKLDAVDATCIAVMEIPNKGIGIAINDRLRRAATR
ncbi:MAG: L-threonylcarbamoyladenylate synthase [Alphaproteobacteria bacterium]